MEIVGGTALAVLQDNLKEKYLNDQKPSADEWKKLTKNLWVKTAEVMAPGNLPLRNFCLEDIFRNEQLNETKIKKMFYKLAKNRLDNQLLWAEGYSYWLYTKEILSLYISHFKWNSLSEEINSMERNFARTGYHRKGVLYPAPYGDLRDIPLEQHLQGTSPDAYTMLAHISKENSNYTMDPIPMRMNTHTPKEASLVYISDGMPYVNGGSFKFYEGYDKKYSNKWQEILDCLDPRRFL